MKIKQMKTALRIMTLSCLILIIPGILQPIIPDLHASNYLKGLTGIMGARTLQSFNEAKINRVEFPLDYRNWTRVKSEVILEGHENYNSFGGFHHVYANNKALSSLKEGKSFENGSVLVFDLMEENAENNTITEGTRKVIGVMVKDHERFPDTGGWGFEDFKTGDPNQRSVSDMKNQCFICHETQKSTDYVYSKYHF